MPRHTKKENDLGARATDVAEHEAEKVWKGIGNYGEWSQIYDETFHSALVEFESLNHNPSDR